LGIESGSKTRFIYFFSRIFSESHSHSHETTTRIVGQCINKLRLKNLNYFEWGNPNNGWTRERSWKHTQGIIYKGMYIIRVYIFLAPMTTEMMRWSLGLFDRPQIALKLSTTHCSRFTCWRVPPRGEYHPIWHVRESTVSHINLTGQRAHQPHKFDRSESTSAT